MTDPDVSVVVCTYNRSALLRGALESLMALRTGDRFRYEIVVVDNASTDDTARVIEEAAERSSVPLRGVCESRPGVTFARNCGIHAARGAWIAFFDDDQVADPDWLVELLRLADEAKSRCVGGAVRLLLPEQRLRELPWVCRNILGESPEAKSPRRFDHRLQAGTGNLLIHRTVFDEVGRFDESIQEAGEDTDFLNRIRRRGIEGWFAPAAVIWHTVPEYRLEERNLRWVFRRNGLVLARRERQRWGRLAIPLLLAARLGYTAARAVPRWLHGRLARSPRSRLEALCLLWRADGYARHMLGALGMSWLAAEPAAAELNFRTERERLAQGGPPNPSGAAMS